MRLVTCKNVFLSVICAVGFAGLSQSARAADTLPQIKFDSDATGRIGTIDTAKLAKDLGWDREMNANMKVLEGQLINEMQKLNTLFGAQLEAKQKELGLMGTDAEKTEKFKKLSEAQQQQYAGMANQAQQMMGQVQQYAQQQMQKYIADWNKEYSEAIRPLVQQVAVEKRISVVLNVQVVPVVYTDSGVDITDTVAKVARNKPPTLNAVALPKLFDKPLPTTQEVLNMAATQNVKPITPTPGTGTGTKPK